jgi:hypothetical protein
MDKQRDINGYNSGCPVVTKKDILSYPKDILSHPPRSVRNGVWRGAVDHVLGTPHQQLEFNREL